MKTSKCCTLYVVYSAMAVLLVLISIHFLDENVALHINGVLLSKPFIRKSFKNIPNLLPVIVILGTAIMWIIYLKIKRRGNILHVRFLKLAAFAVPVAFLSKMFLQFIFGRTNIQTWLTHGGPIEFTWFTPLSQQPCFPSGHMTVFTAFLAAVWIYYPRWRPVAAATLMILASALIVTNYHFLGDVIAGFFCGILVTSTVGMLFSKVSAETLPR